MRLPVIMPVKDRIELTKQTIETLFKNTSSKFDLIIISDNSEKATNDYLARLGENAKVIYMPESKGGPVCKNAGMAVAGDSEFYYITDNDVYYMPKWDEVLLGIMDAFPQVGVVGARNHSYHGVVATKENKGIRINLTLQQAGFSMLVRKKTWLDCGPFLHYQNVELGRDDVKFCDVVRGAGWEIAQPEKPVAFHCGIKNTFGKDTTGIADEQKQEFPAGVLVR